MQSVHQITWNHIYPNLLRFTCFSCLPENSCKHYELGTIVIPESILLFSRSPDETATALNSDASTTSSPSLFRSSQREDTDMAFNFHATSAASSSFSSKMSQREDPPATLNSAAANQRHRASTVFLHVDNLQVIALMQEPRIPRKTTFWDSESDCNSSVKLN